VSDPKKWRSPVTGEEYDPSLALRHTEIATFLRAPLARSIDEVDIALVGVPYDGGVTHRPGARHGPREIRNMSTMMRSYHHITRLNPFEACRIADVGDVRFRNIYNLDEAIKDIETFFQQIVDAGLTAVAAGGDHSISYPILKALGEPQPVGLVHIDAHTDTWGPFMGSRFHHGAPFRMAVDGGYVDPKRAVQIGIRGAQNTQEGWDYSRESGMRVVFIEEFVEMGVQGVIEEARRVVGDGPTYLSFDVDALDPVHAPGTGTPEVGGMTTREALSLLRGLRGLNLVGGDVVEVAPPFDPSGNTALVGATLLYEIVCLLAELHAAKRQA
jgi:guanidinopropionase